MIPKFWFCNDLKIAWLQISSVLWENCSRSKVPDKEQDPYNWNDNLSKLLIGIVTILEPDMEFDKYFTQVKNHSSCFVKTIS